jgi:hypothetical protein
VFTAYCLVQVSVNTEDETSHKMTAVTFKGLVTSLSHIFYLPGNSKCFFLEVVPHPEDSDRLKIFERLTVIARLEGLHESFQANLIVFLHRDELKTYSLFF